MFDWLQSLYNLLDPFQVLCLIGAVGSGLWLESLTSLDRLYVAPFLSSAPSPGFEGFLTFWTFIIIFQVANVT